MTEIENVAEPKFTRLISLEGFTVFTVMFSALYLCGSVGQFCVVGPAGTLPASHVVASVEFPSE
jgi:hypothetical protein